MRRGTRTEFWGARQTREVSLCRQFGAFVPSRSTTMSSDDNLDKLERLAALRDKGVFTDEEFEAEKQQLRSSMAGANAATRSPVDPRALQPSRSSLFDLIFRFDGRTNRAKFWLGQLLTSLAVVIAAVAMVAINVILSALLICIPVFMACAVGAKRLHDRDKSAWWLLAFYLLPMAGELFGLRGINPESAGAILWSLAGFVAWVWGLIEMGCLRGTNGPNRYGPDPLQEVSQALGP